MEHFRRERMHHPTVIFQSCAAKAADELCGNLRFVRLMQQRRQRFPILRYERIKIDQRFDAVCHPVGQSSYHHTAIGMADENDVAEFLGLDAAGDVANVGFEGDVFSGVMGAIADARMGRCENLVPHLAQHGRGVTVTPAAVPSAVNENERLLCRIHQHDSQVLLVASSRMETD